MTIVSTVSRVSYPGPGAGPFAFTFKISQLADLRVMRVTAGVPTVLSSPTDYSVTPAPTTFDPYGNGGSITLTTALNVADVLVIRRAPQPLQSSSFQNHGKFFPKSVEDSDDYLMMVLQSHADDISRSVRLADSNDPAAITTLLPAPSAGLVLGWDATGTALVNTPGASVPGPPGPPGVGIPVFATPAARDAALPSPLVDTTAIVKSLGYQQRFGVPTSGPNKWLSEGLTRAGGPVDTAYAHGALGDGVHDDTVFVNAAATAMAASGGVHEIDPGTYYINGAVTLSGHTRPKRGAKFLLGLAGSITIPANAFFDCGPFWIFDTTTNRTTTGGPRIFYQPGCIISEYLPEWHGVTGNGSTLDDIFYDELYAHIPNFSVVREQLGRVHLISGPIRARFLDSYTHYCQSWPIDGFSGTPAATQFVWNSSAAHGAPMYCSDRSGYISLIGMVFQAGDDTGAGLGSDCCIEMDQGSFDITAGSPIFTASTRGTFKPSDQGKFFKVQFAGAADGSLPGIGTILSVDSDTQIHMSFNSLVSSPNHNAAFSMGSEDFNRTGSLRIHTQPLIRRCTFLGGLNNFSWIGVSNSRNATSNCEYGAIVECLFAGSFNSDRTTQRIYGVPLSNPSITGSLTGTTFTASSPVFTSADLQKRIRIGGCGPGPNSATSNGGPQGAGKGTRGALPGALLDAVITGFTSSTVVTISLALGNGSSAWSSSPTYIPGDVVLSGGNLYTCILTNNNQVPPNATFWTPLTTISSVPFIVDQQAGTGFRNGPSFNAKDLYIETTTFRNCGVGIDIEGGSYCGFRMNFPANDINVQRGGTQSESSVEWKSNSEGSRMHYLDFGFASAESYRIEDGRFSLPLMNPSAGYFTLGTAPLDMTGCHFDNNFSPGSALFDCRQQSAILRIKQPRWDLATTWFNSDLQKYGNIPFGNDNSLIIEDGTNDGTYRSRQLGGAVLPASEMGDRINSSLRQALSDTLLNPRQWTILQNQLNFWFGAVWYHRVRARMTDGGLHQFDIPADGQIATVLRLVVKPLQSDWIPANNESGTFYLGNYAGSVIHFNLVDTNLSIGWWCHIKRGLDDNGSNLIIQRGGTSELIDGATSVTLSAQGQCKGIIKVATNDFRVFTTM